MEEKSNKFKETIDSIVVAFVIAMIIRAFCVQAYKIPSGSMLDTLLIGDHIIVNKLAYKFKEPAFQDIIVFEYPLEPSKDFIKRVIGCPGDKIKITNKVLYRNGQPVDEKYVIHKDTWGVVIPDNPRDYVDEFTVPKDYYFVMGDNRDSSFDSRYWGFVKKDLIKGEAWFIYWSWQLGDNFTIRFNRILKPIR
jgi:signal peptidase I